MPKQARAGNSDRPRTLTIKMDKRMEEGIERLKRRLGVTSKAQVLRLAGQLLFTVKQAQADGLKLTIHDEQGNLVKEIVLL